VLGRFQTHLIHGLRIMNQNLSISGHRVGHNSIPIDSHVCEGSKPLTSAEKLRFHVSSLRMLQDIQSLLGLMASFWICVNPLPQDSAKISAVVAAGQQELPFRL
jgi:hypothetical protein